MRLVLTVAQQIDVKYSIGVRSTSTISTSHYLSTYYYTYTSTVVVVVVVVVLVTVGRACSTIPVYTYVR